MQILLHTLAGKTFPLEVEASDSVGNVKAKIQETENIPIDQQRLVFNNRQLNDALTLAEYHIMNDSAVQLHFRPSGGGYPQYILTTAAALNNDRGTVDSLFNSLYDSMLHYWFPSTDGFHVCPYWTIPNSRMSVARDFTITFAVEHIHRLVLMVEVKAPLDFHGYHARKLAILQIVKRFDQLGPTNQHVDRLYAILAIGKKWRACYTSKGGDSKDAKPVRGVAKKASLESAEPDCWNPDITSDESFTALQGIVEKIKGFVT